jgi:uncharacterized protein (TIGR00255 family)
VQSMTGFGRSEGVIGSSQFTVEVRSVNHRYLDLRFRLPAALAAFENTFAEFVRSKIQRGSLDISIRQRAVTSEKGVEGNTRFIVDTRAAASLVEACQALNAQFKTPAVPSLELLHATGKVFLAVEDSAEAAPLSPELRALVAHALTALVTERTREGAQTQATLAATVACLQTLAGQWKTAAAAHPEKIRERLEKKIAQWNLGGTADPQRLELEVAFFADRADIAEEIQRFEAHLDEFSKLVAGKGPVGRKLDFLTQELHRETNTVASKADDLSLSRLAVEAKTSIEKLREQVQNVE